jgi:hypothetical protein
MSPTYEVEWSLNERGTVMVKAPSAEAAKEKFYLMSATELSASARRSDLECEVIE